MNGVVRMRLSGELADVTAVLATLVGVEGLRLSVSDRTYPDRSGHNVRRLRRTGPGLADFEGNPMKTGFVTETHLLVYCSDCREPWHCGERDCPRDACCLGTLDNTEAVRRIETQGWRVQGERVLCPCCVRLAACQSQGHHWEPDSPCCIWCGIDTEAYRLIVEGRP